MGRNSVQVRRIGSIVKIDAALLRPNLEQLQQFQDALRPLVGIDIVQRLDPFPILIDDFRVGVIRSFSRHRLYPLHVCMHVRWHLRPGLSIDYRMHFLVISCGTVLLAMVPAYQNMVKNHELSKKCGVRLIKQSGFCLLTQISLHLIQSRWSKNVPG